MPWSRQRKLWFVLGLTVLAYPIYLVANVIAAGHVGEHCTRTSGRGGVGAFCSWGEHLGTVLFGAAHAHLGYALLVALATAVLACFGYLAITSSGSAPDSP